MPRATPLLLLGAALLTGTNVTLSAQAPAAPPPAGGGPERGEHATEGGSVRYRLYRPPAAAAPGALPLLVLLHGCTQDAEDAARGTRMDRWAEERGFLVLYPEQPATRHPQRCWSWYEPAHRAREGGEAAALADLVRAVVEREGADPARVHVAGISAGGAMALILGATHPELFSGVAVHSGIAFAAASGVQEALRAMQGALPAPGAAALLAALGDGARLPHLIVLQGAEDPVVHPSSADAILRQWAEASAALGRPLSAETAGRAGEPGVTRYRTADGEVVLEGWMIPGVGHAWSGGSAEGTYTHPDGPDASREIVRFLLGDASGSAAR